jgi:hypothetical protein
VRTAGTDEAGVIAASSTERKKRATEDLVGGRELVDSTACEEKDELDATSREGRETNRQG